MYEWCTMSWSYPSGNGFICLGSWWVRKRIILLSSIIFLTFPGLLQTWIWKGLCFMIFLPCTVPTRPLFWFFFDNFLGPRMESVCDIWWLYITSHIPPYLALGVETWQFWLESRNTHFFRRKHVFCSFKKKKWTGTFEQKKYCIK